MITLPGIKVLALIYESANSLIYRSLIQSTNRPLILKLLKEDYPTPAELIRYQQEYQITHNFQLEGVVKAYELNKYQNTMVMLLEDFGGESLEILLQKKPFSLLEVLRLAIQITTILGKIHQANIIHKDINPSNIVFNQKTGELKIIDFGLSTILSRENPTLKNPNILEGTLAYISPEQTGRMNRALDYRTDFYSLGVTLYELLTNQLPFDSNDAMELVHCHIAKQATPAHIINSKIPLIVSEIVMKLLAKSAEERYQSTYGIKDDLETCFTQLRTKTTIEPFRLASRDTSDKFQISQKLYGREAQVEQLLAAFNRVNQGQTELMLVAGYSGIGKSALVQEIYKPITQQRGYFISGKFDQFQRNIPYSAVVKAFQELVRQLLTESETQLQLWREKLITALSVNGQIIIDVIPEIELIIGKQVAVTELSPAETQNRFNIVFQNFIGIFCHKEHPLVIFLDDLQWTDAATLKLIKFIITKANTNSLFLIGAYRDNEVSATHPLMTTVENIQKSGSVVNTVFLQPLAISQVNQLIADTLKCEKSKSKELAELVLSKTEGNPFFMNEFIKELYTDKLLNFDKGIWQWNLEQIQARGITDNVVELMAQKIQKLPQVTQEVLKLAACIDNQFDLKILSIVEGQSQKAIANQIWSAVQEGLILPIGDDYKFLQIDRNPEQLIVTYKFIHDRVQQAAYSLIPEARKQAIHLKIGQLILNNISLEQREEKIFDIVNQLNFGIELLENQQDRDKLAKLNLIAGKKAKASTAYQPAFTYLTKGLQLLATDRWLNEYDLTLELYVEAAEVASLSGNFEEMEKLASIVLQQATSLLDKVKVYEIKIQAYTVQNQPLEAINTALSVLKLLGIHFPQKPNKLAILIELGKTKLSLAGKRIEDLINLPVMTDPDQLAAMRILSSILSAAHFATPNLLPLIVFKQVNVSIKYGNTALSSCAYATYGLILSGEIVGDVETGYRFGKLALLLIDKFNDKKLKARNIFIVNYFIKHWKEHLRETLTPLRDAYLISMETGDLEYAAYSACVYSYHSYVMGKELATVDREMAMYSNTLSQLKQETSFYYNQLNRQVVLNLMGQSEDKCRLIGESYDEVKMLPLHLEANAQNICHSLYFHKLVLCYLFQDYQQAISHAKLAEKYDDSAVGTIPLYHFYNSLVHLAIYSEVSKSEQKLILQKVKANQKKLKKWANFAPMTHLHKFYIVEAERYRVLGENAKAIDYYDKAIAFANKNEYINEEALAYELAAKFYLAIGKAKIAELYMQDARYFYLSWGAIAKVQDIDTRYPHLLQKKTSGRGTLRKTTSLPSKSSRGSTSHELDLTTVLKASQTLSEEILLDKLLFKLMQIIIENAGAQKGFFILESKGKMLIEISGVVDSNDINILHSVPIEGTQVVSLAIIYYVARSLETIILNDATHEGLFINDPYIKEHQPKSILCFPLLNQSKLVGIIYLENNLITGAFTPERVEVLNLLSSQAAISIKNARLYQNMADLNTAYERFVPSQFIQLLEKASIIDVQLGDQVQQKMSVLFSDIRDFTTLSESMTPQENFKFINAYLSRMSPVISNHHGFIDKYIGDAIMALFNRSADDAVKAGVAMLHTLKSYNLYRQNQGYLPINIGIGINTGCLMLGTVGDKNRMDGTVISDAVNLASRIESLTKTYGVSMLISQHTFQDLEDSNQYDIRLIYRVKVKGKSEMVSLFEVFDADSPELREGKLLTRTIFEKALLLYNQEKFKEAKQLFSECLTINPIDKAAQIYQQYCREREEMTELIC